jgi:hypothetical protein
MLKEIALQNCWFIEQGQTIPSNGSKPEDFGIKCPPLSYEESGWLRQLQEVSCQGKFKVFVNEHSDAVDSVTRRSQSAPITSGLLLTTLLRPCQPLA